MNKYGPLMSERQSFLHKAVGTQVRTEGWDCRRKSGRRGRNEKTAQTQQKTPAREGAQDVCVCVVCRGVWRTWEVGGGCVVYVVNGVCVRCVMCVCDVYVRVQDLCMCICGVCVMCGVCVRVWTLSAVCVPYVCL